MTWLVIGAVVLVVWLVLERGNELFCLSWREGELRLVRGRIPPALKRDLGDALGHMKVKSCTVKAKREANGARLTASGLDDFALQRLRNNLMLYPVAQLRAAKAPDQNRLLRLLGFSALVWIFGRRDD